MLMPVARDGSEKVAYRRVTKTSKRSETLGQRRKGGGNKQTPFFIKRYKGVKRRRRQTGGPKWILKMGE